MPTSNLLCSGFELSSARARAPPAPPARASAVALRLDRGVGHVGRDLQLDLFELRFDLTLLNPRPRERSPPPRSCQADSSAFNVTFHVG